MATLTKQQIAKTGLNPALVAADVAGDDIPNTGREYLHVKNDDASSTTVTVDAKQTCSGGELHDLVVAVPAGEERLIGPFDPAIYNAADGNVEVSYSSVTSLTVGAFELP